MCYLPTSALQVYSRRILCIVNFTSVKILNWNIALLVEQKQLVNFFSCLKTSKIHETS